MGLTDHLEKLNYFFQTSKFNTINEASKALRITQPSLTKSIKSLERALDRSLFVRSSRGVNLTPEGQILADFCQDLFRQLEQIEHKIKCPTDPMAGKVRVGTYESIAIYFWPKFLRSFLAKHPNLEFELSTNRSARIQAMVEEGTLDFGLIIEPHQSHTLVVEELSKDAFEFYGAYRLPSKLKKTVTDSVIYMPDALAGIRDDRLEDLVGAMNEFRKDLKFFRTSSLEAVKELVAEGIGIGLLPRHVASSGVREKSLQKITVKGFPKRGIGSHRIYLIYRKDRPPTSAQQGLIMAIKNHDWRQEA